MLRRAAVGCLVLALAGCDEETPTGPSPAGFRARGLVSDYVSTAAAAGVLIEFRELDPADRIVSRAITDAAGAYELTVPELMQYEVFVDGSRAGAVHLTWPSYRGDLFIRGGTCIARYGVVSDARTLRPLAGVTAALQGQTSVTDAAGWYRIDLGCPEVTLPGGTTLISFSRPGYKSGSQVVGRGVHGVSRLDFRVTPE